jgi:hypothetical protein
MFQKVQGAVVRGQDKKKFVPLDLGQSDVCIAAVL